MHAYVSLTAILKRSCGGYRASPYFTDDLGHLFLVIRAANVIKAATNPTPNAKTAKSSSEEKATMETIVTIAPTRNAKPMARPTPDFFGGGDGLGCREGSPREVSVVHQTLVGGSVRGGCGCGGTHAGGGWGGIGCGGVGGAGEGDAVGDAGPKVPVRSHHGSSRLASSSSIPPPANQPGVQHSFSLAASSSRSGSWMLRPGSAMSRH